MRMIDKDKVMSVLNDNWLALSPKDSDNEEVKAERAAMCRGIDYAFNIVSQFAEVGGWISVKDRMPDSNHVLARCEIRGLYKPKNYICVAFYAKRHSVSCGNCVSEDYCYDYDEEADEYYLKEGWYEVIRNWDEYGSVVIGDFVTHWMPLPSTGG